MNPLRPGAVAWRIGDRSGTPLRCIVVRPALAGALIEVRASRFSRNSLTIHARDLFPDRDACRAEIQRRANVTKENADD
jgi:hypothetical protein